MATCPDPVDRRRTLVWPVTAAEAKQLGLVGHVVPDGQALDKALKIASQLEANGPSLWRPFCGPCASRRASSARCAGT